MKYFNTEGTCIPEENYMVDLTGRIEKIEKDYISRGKYFTINRARQYGKTTLLHSREATSQVAVLARIFGDCREGQIPRCLLRGI